MGPNALELEWIFSLWFWSPTPGAWPFPPVRPIFRPAQNHSRPTVPRALERSGPHRGRVQGRNGCPDWFSFPLTEGFLPCGGGWLPLHLGVRLGWVGTPPLPPPAPLSVRQGAVCKAVYKHKFCDCVIDQATDKGTCWVTYKVRGRVRVRVRGRVRGRVTELGSFMVPIGLHHQLDFGRGGGAMFNPPP